MISTPHKTRTFSSNDQIPRKRFCSRGVAWTRQPKSRPNRFHREKSYSIYNIGNMMGCDHQSCVPVGPFAGELWHFEYFPTMTVRQLLIFDDITVTVVRICCCIHTQLYSPFEKAAQLYEKNESEKYQILSKLVHAFGLQTPITAECPERRY